MNSLCGSNLDLYSDMSLACPHQVGTFTNITSTPSVYNEIRANQSHMYYFESSKFTAQRANGADRTMLMRLEPCHGVVYLFIRRTRPCWPNPWSCVGKSTEICEWTHYHSTINGTTDGQATLFEVPLTSTQWFITVFGKSDAKYSLSIIEDPTSYPRLPENGIVRSRQVNANTMEIAWARSKGREYSVYSSMYFESSETALLNPNLLVSPNHILDTVCGLSANTDHAYSSVSCATEICKANVTGLIQKRKYVMNVVALDSVNVAYAGTLVESLFEKPTSQNTNVLENIGITVGSVLAVCLGTFAWLQSRF